MELNGMARISLRKNVVFSLTSEPIYVVCRVLQNKDRWYLKGDQIKLFQADGHRLNRNPE